MKPGRTRIWLIQVLGLLVSSSLPVLVIGEQENLQPLVNPPAPTLRFDWPIIRVGTATYEEGPTGVTVIQFGRKVYSAIDVRGTPGTVNAPYMNLLYDWPELDAVVFAGGSWYGLEAVTAVATALKDDDIRDGNAFGDEVNIAMSVGSIIFDFGSRRLNEIYPDKRLAQAAFRAAVPNEFPLGAFGAGRFAVNGWFFGCNAHSGQGAAYREVGDHKFAAFVVVNSVGVVTRRDGSVAACYRAPGWPEKLYARDLFADFPESREAGWTGVSDEKQNTKNTTVSLIVTNQKLEPALLKRLAVQVHTSMARAIQPFGTISDGDVLYAVSTAELEDAEMFITDLGAIASEVMWDAILSSIPEQAVPDVPASRPILGDEELQHLSGDYVFSRFVTLRISANGGSLYGQASGERDAYAIGRDAAVELLPVSRTDFMVPGRYPMTLRFAGRDRLVINPGHWQQVGIRDGAATSR